MIEVHALFLGNFLSARTGTKTIAEKLADHWRASGGPRVTLRSSLSNRLARLVSMALSVLVFRGNVVNVDVFSGNSLAIAGLCGALARWRGIPLVLTLRGGAIPEDLTRRPQAYRTVLSRADRVQSPSRYLIDQVSRRVPVEVQYLPNPVDLKRFGPGEGDRRNLLWVRAFTSIYNPRLAVETFARLAAEFAELRLTMVGPDLGGLAEVEEAMRRLGIRDRVDVVGPVDNARLPAFYRSHAVYLNTTSYESFGTAVVEAAATAMPVVSTRVGELPLLWRDGENIVFSAAPDPESMAAAVRSLLMDPALAGRIGRSARERSLEFEWERVCGTWARTLQETANRGQMGHVDGR